MSTQTGRLAAAAHAEAKRRYPGSYSKLQLVECSREVFGGFGADSLRTVKTEDEIAHKRNAMALIDGRYPLSMDDCHVVGISGGCGESCPVFLRGDCESPPDEASR